MFDSLPWARRAGDPETGESEVKLGSMSERAKKCHQTINESKRQSLGILQRPVFPPAVRMPSRCIIRDRSQPGEAVQDFGLDEVILAFPWLPPGEAGLSRAGGEEVG